MKIKMKICLLSGLLLSSVACADTIGNYMTVVNTIPKVEMQPTEQAQAWVRSARNILSSTDETMAQTIVAMNNAAAKHGQPLFCFPPGEPFDGHTIDELIQKTYTNLQQTQGEVAASTSVSDVVMIGMLTKYRCSTSESGSLQASNSTREEIAGSPPSGFGQPVATMQSVQSLPSQEALPPPAL